MPTWRAPKPQVHAAWIHRLQHHELLGDLEARIIGQHDSARTDADGLRLRTEPRQQDFRARIRQSEQSMMLGQPIAMIAQAVGQLRQLYGGCDGLRRRCRADDGRLIEDGNGKRRRHDLIALALKLFRIGLKREVGAWIA
jgi:hypothetical protein